MDCKNHAQKQAYYQCESCRNYFCESCLTERKLSEAFTAYICKECGGRCIPLFDLAKTAPHQKPKGGLFGFKAQAKAKPSVRRDIPPEEKPHALNFWLSLLTLIFFPLKGKGIFLTLIAAVFFFTLGQFYNPIYPFGLYAFVIFLAFFSMYLLKVMHDSFGGSRRLLNLPDLNFWTDAASTIALILLAMILCFGPANIYFLLTSDLGAGFAVFMGLGFFFFPMFFIKIVAIRRGRALNPFKVISSISRTFFAYCAVIVIIGGLIFLFLYVNMEFLSDYGTKGLALSYLIMVYMLLMDMRLLGLFARCYHSRILSEG